MIDDKTCVCGGKYIYQDGKWVCDYCGSSMRQMWDFDLMFVTDDSKTHKQSTDRVNNKVCNCGGTYVYKNGKWACDHCDRPMPQIMDSQESQRVAVADSHFAQDKFVDAEELYGEIVKSFPQCYSAYWGLALIKHGIKLVDDTRTGKKVPTCWSPEISSIKDDKYYKKVLALAPPTEKPFYEKQGELIEKISQEWQVKARKIKPYDVFLCYKDTEDDKAKVRTQDSIELADIYHHLIGDGYNVFFSRYSLDERVGENYEPYIFQALTTAKVMIVYGSKEEYFDSAWMKNEWTRFLHQISEGRKQQNALLPVVKDLNPSALPPRLRTLQVLDAGKNTFYSDLTRYIDKVLSTSESAVELQRNKVKFEKRGEVTRQQSRKIVSRSLQAKEDIEKVSAQGEQLMRVIDSFVKQGQFSRAEKFCDTWIKSNPSNYRDLEELVKAILVAGNCKLAKKYVSYIVANAPERKRAQLWQYMLADGYTNIDKWAEEIIIFRHISFEYMQKVLPLVSENEISVLYAYYTGIGMISEYSEELKQMILNVLEYNGNIVERYKFLKEITDRAIDDSTDNYAYFEFVITVLDSNSYRIALTSFLDNSIEREEIPAIIKILPMLEGTEFSRAYTSLIELYFKNNDFASGVAETEKMLGYIDSEVLYSGKLQNTINTALNYLSPETIASADESIFRLLSFKKESDGLDCDYYIRLAQLCREARYKKGLERYAKLLLSCGDKGKYHGYFYLMLLDLKCFSDEEVSRLKYDIADTDSYNTWLANCEGTYLEEATRYLKSIDEIKEKRIEERKNRKYEKRTYRMNKINNGVDGGKVALAYVGKGFLFVLKAIATGFYIAWPAIKIALIGLLAIAPFGLSILATVLAQSKGYGVIAGILFNLVPSIIVLAPSYLGLIRRDSTFKVVLSIIALVVAFLWNGLMCIVFAFG